MRRFFCFLHPSMLPGSFILSSIVMVSLAACAAHCQSPEALPASEPGPALQVHGERSLLKSNDYEYLLDQLFPIDHAIPLGLDYTMVLRFEPHLHPESQVVVRRWHDGHVEATIQQVISGNAWRSAYTQIVPGQPLDFPAMQGTVKVRESKLKVTPAEVQAWHDAMFPALAQQFTHVRLLDKDIAHRGKHQAESTGTRYQLWFIQQDDEVHAVAWDTEIDNLPTGSFALTKWMNQVRFYAANHWVAKAPPAQPAATEPMPAAPATPQP